MGSTDDSRQSSQQPSVVSRITRFVIGACLVGGLGGGLIGVIFVIITSIIDPNSARMGGSNDPGGLAVIFFFAWGFAGLILGLIIGAVGALVIATRA